MIQSIRKIIADRPWILVVVCLGLFMAMTMVFLVIALTHPPHLI